MDTERKFTKTTGEAAGHEGENMSGIFEAYMADDLGAVYSSEKTVFRLWAPTAEEVSICLYQQGDGDCLLDKQPMTKDKKGTWIYQKRGDLDQVYYTYLVTVDGVVRETIDPYAKACGVNGQRGMVVDLMATNPDGFYEEKRPAAVVGTDMVICEISVADMTAEEDCGIKGRGKYVGLAEKGTKSPLGIPTGLDYLRQLGITHVQLMPSYDFGSVDETQQKGQYNWGYDPVNYNIPEGSYATDPYHGQVRIREYKQMVQAFHAAGIGVIMDVVYNHTYNIEDSCFQKTVPDYYYRMYSDGRYSDASSCGNEIASEKPMVRKYIIDSVCYWAREYHIDGFRFDLMGILDLETMQQLRDALCEINPDIVLYGEGWTGDDSVLPEEKRALKCNISRLNGVGAFSDDIRDCVRGHVFYEQERGFVSGKAGLENAIRYSVVGAAAHPQVDYQAYQYTKSGPWAKNPVDTINYVSCHDNLTLWDKLALSCPEASREQRLSMNRLAAAMVFTSQGIPFFLSGEEIGRSKPTEGSDRPSENSFNLSLYTNKIRYGLAAENAGLLEYYKGLIALRKGHKGFRMATKEEVVSRLHFMDVYTPHVVAFYIENEEEILYVAYNANPCEIMLKLPTGGVYNILVENEKAGDECLRSGADVILVGPVSCLVASRKLA